MILSLQLLFLGGLAAGSTVLGGWLLTKSRHNGRRLSFLLAFGAGFMLATVLLDVLPENFQRWEGHREGLMLWVLVGYLMIQLIEHTIAPHFHFGEEGHESEIRRHGVAVTATIALGLHAFFDGVTITSGFLVDSRLGILLFVAVLLHKVPEGVTIASIMLSAGRTRQAALKATFLIAAATFVGLFGVALWPNSVAVALPLSAGATLYIAASDLIPEVNREGGWRSSLIIFLGVGFFYLTHLFVHYLLP